MIRPVVVGTDLTHASDEAILQGEARACRDGSPLTIVHATSPVPWLNGTEPQETAQLRDLVPEQVYRLTGRSTSHYSIVVERGLAHSVLERVANAQRALLVVGARATDKLGHTRLEDVAERVVLHARGAVLVARKHPTSGRVLVAVDQPFSGSDVLAVSAEEARRRASRLTVLHCVNRGFLETLGADLLGDGAFTTNPLRVSFTAAYQALRAELRRRDIDADLRVVDGGPEVVIAKLARDWRAELLILGCSQRLMRTCRVTRTLVRRTDCSVLVVAEPPRAVRRAPGLQLGPGYGD
jgi:nucleotide-binding universal stress UspA family protein